MIPPLMGIFVTAYGNAGYARGYAVFVALSLAALVIFVFLNRAVPAEAAEPRAEEVETQHRKTSLRLLISVGVDDCNECLSSV